MLAFLMGLIDPVSRITQGIIDWQTKKLVAQTDTQRIEADQNIAQLQARRDVLIAESKSPWNVLARMALMIGPCFYVAKIFIWDKMLGLGSTDDLTPNEWYLVFVVYGFYFLDSMKGIIRK